VQQAFIDVNKASGCVVEERRGHYVLEGRLLAVEEEH